MKRSSIRPSIRLSVCPTIRPRTAACNRFAAERRADRRYRSTAAGAQQQRRRSTKHVTSDLIGCSETRTVGAQSVRAL